MNLRVLSYKDSNYAGEVARLNRFAHPIEAVTETVRGIIEQVRTRGDDALTDFTQKFDHVHLTAPDFRVTRSPVSPGGDVARALKYSLANIRDFSKARRPKDWRRRNREGAMVGEQFRPIQRIGINVPGGTAPLVSSALMTVALAQCAGVPEIVVVSPPPIDNALLYALKLSGATEVYQVGGSQAIAALAYGTTAIPRVQKIFGPGNAYVVEAKRQVLGVVAIDQLPGPSEIAVVADETANPAFVAADLLAQAEHGPGSQILFLTASRKVMNAVVAEMERQLPTLSRQKYLLDVLEQGCTFLLTKSTREALNFADAYAPEHLSLCIAGARQAAKHVCNAGAIFIGNFSPVAAGDFLAGPSHTLPTGGAAKSFAGLTIDQFYRRTSVVEYQERSLRPVVPFIETFSRLEKLDAHGRSARIRLEPVGKKGKAKSAAAEKEAQGLSSKRSAVPPRKKPKPTARYAHATLPE